MLPASVRILVCTEPQDMRRGFDTLAAVVREHLFEEPQSGSLFVFLGKRWTRAKVLWWDKNGYCILYKRLHRAFFAMPDHVTCVRSVRIDAEALAQLLAGVEKKMRGDLLH